MGRICTRGGEQIFLRGHTNRVIGEQRNDILIEWAQALMGKEYLIGGKLGGKDVKDTRSPQ